MKGPKVRGKTYVELREENQALHKQIEDLMRPLKDETQAYVGAIDLNSVKEPKVSIFMQTSDGNRHIEDEISYYHLHDVGDTLRTFTQLCTQCSSKKVI